MEIIIDYKNYTSFYTCSKRKAARAIISRGNKYLLIYKYGGLQFPGGIENGEKPEEALVREVMEETGLHVLKDSIKKY
ncbi:MAG: NUDIX domain-containing protein [Clostridiales bacterium]|jgi:8-oxo-dGTP pyrophosphatase MutT (NUDIX family)|nr:NUDIX domain-containing protein [Clostridiales bacterium]